MPNTRRNVREGDVQKRGWVLDDQENEELEREMNIFEQMGLALMAFGLGMFILIVIVCLFARFMDL